MTSIKNNTIEQKPLSILTDYNGANNYIINLKIKKESNNKFYLTPSQSEYLINYSKIIPKVAKKWVDIDLYFAKKIADEKLLTFIPEKIWVEKLLVEKEKSYHIWGKILSGDTNYDFWLPKGAFIKSHVIKEVIVDYTKYSNRTPLEHQKPAIEKLAGSSRFILADDMGLGKTLSAVIAALETNEKRILVVCPATLKINWKREFEFFTKKTIFIAESKTFSDDADIVIVNYDILKNFHNSKNIKESRIYDKFDIIIADECHYVSNPQSKRTKIFNHFAKKSKYLWLLSGTPMTNRPINYFNLLSLIDSPVAQNWVGYAVRYCEGYQFNAGGRKIWNVSGASNLEELRERTSKQFLRRLKTEVLELPEKIITPVYLKLKSKLYENLMGEYYDWYDNKKEESTSLTIQFSKLMKVRQVIAEEKINNTIELAQNIIDQDKKVIIFTNFTDTLNRIADHFGKQSVRLDGSTPKLKRQESVDQFQENEKVKVFVGNMRAAGVGITLTSAEAVIINDLSFVPGELSQAEDRAYRYGQKNNVLVYYPIFHNTIEGGIYDIVVNKKQIIDTVMGDNLDKSDVVAEIMNRIQEKR